MIRVVGLVLCVAVVCGCSGKPLGAPSFVDSDVRWGEVVNGLQAGLAKRVYDEGKAPGAGSTKGMVYLSFRLRNASNKDVKVLWPVAMRGAISEPLKGDESVKVVVSCATATPEAKQSSKVKTAEFKSKMKPFVQTIEPGEIAMFALQLGPEKFGMDSFGAEQTFSAKYVNFQESIKYETAIGDPVGGLWVGEVKTGEVTDGVAAPTTQKAGK